MNPETHAAASQASDDLDQTVTESRAIRRCMLRVLGLSAPAISGGKSIFNIRVHSTLLMTARW
jgi:hypothetical protein